MTIDNQTGRLIIVTDIQIAGVSVLAQVRQQMFAAGRLEDAAGRLEDPPGSITILPNRQIDFVGADCVWWIEE